MKGKTRTDSSLRKAPWPFEAVALPSDEQDFHAPRTSTYEGFFVSAASLPCSLLLGRLALALAGE